MSSWRKTSEKLVGVVYVMIESVKAVRRAQPPQWRCWRCGLTFAGSDPPLCRWPPMCSVDCGEGGESK